MTGSHHLDYLQMERHLCAMNFSGRSSEKHLADQILCWLPVTETWNQLSR